MYLLITVIISLIVSSAIIEGKECQTASCKKLAQYLNTIIDDCVDPCDDFSDYVCGNFDRTHRIPEGRTSASTFDDIEDDIALTLKELLEKQSLENSSLPQTKAAIYYRSCLNMTYRNASYKEPILKLVSEITKERNYEDKLRKLISTGIVSRLLSFYALQDSKNPEYYILNIRKGGLILSESTLRSPNEEGAKKQITSYKKYMNRVLDILDLWKDNRSRVDQIVDLNIQIAKVLPSFTDQMDPDKSYNKVTIGDIEKQCKQIPWLSFINNLLEGTGTELCHSDSVLIFSSNYISDVCKILTIYTADPGLNQVLEDDLVWAAISALVEYGSEELVHALQDFKQETMGVIGKEDLWKTCVTSTSGSLEEIVGNMYVKENFEGSKKQDAVNVLSNIRAVFKTVIDKINWMDNKTKEMASLKLRSIDQKIGYSEQLLNETKLMKDNEKITMDIKQYIPNYLGFLAQTFTNYLKGIGEKSPRDRWYIGPQVVNAYYNPASNEIVFPAAIFRYPFYDISFPASVNYGGIGSFIGHEILHGFDTAGSKYDDKGYIRDWWSKDTKAAYNEKAQCIIDQYANYSMYGEKLQSYQTIGEDIADNGGNRMAFMGSRLPNVEHTTLPGLKYTPEQLFFIISGLKWCSIFTKEYTLEKIKNDEHTIWKFRINGPMSNMPEFSEAFKCNHEKPMNRNKKCTVW